MKAWRIPIIIVVVLVVLGAAWFLFFRPAPSGGPQGGTGQVFIVQQGTLETKVSAMGNVTLPEQAKLTFEVGGTVDKVLVEVGDRVAKGRVLAQLETARLKRAVTQAQANLSTAQINLDKLLNPKEIDIIEARGAVRNAQVALENAQTNYENTQVNTDSDIARAQSNLNSYTAIFNEKDALHALGKATVTDVENARLALTQAQKALDSAQQAKPNLIRDAENAVAQAQDNLKLAQDNLQTMLSPRPDDVQLARNQVTAAQVALDAAQESLDKATLTAPFDGVVASVGAKAKETVLTTTIMVYLVNAAEVQLEADVDEVDILQVKLGQEVKVFFDALPDVEFSGRVKAISPVGTKESGVVSYPVTITVEPKSGIDLKEGLTGTSEIIAQTRENVILVPNRAIKLGSSPTVQVQTDKGTEVRPVKLGLTDGQSTEIISGLTVGEKVILSSSRP